jgi:hypothetical protein
LAGDAPFHHTPRPKNSSMRQSSKPSLLAAT